MVRITSVLNRVPVIKFRKGGLQGGQQSGPSAAAPAAASSAGPASGQTTQATAMSTSAINDFDLPLRYQRRPLSQEEIDHINGGGIKDENLTFITKKSQNNEAPDGSAIIKFPRNTILEVDGKARQKIKVNLLITKGGK